MVALSTLVWTSAKPIIKFLVLGGCGAIMARHGLLTPAGAKVVAGLILNYTLPALLFAKMLSCVNQQNAAELGLVAVCSALILLMGGFFGIIIQRFGRVPKRLRRGIIAASMFTNFGDLPISIILAVSDHPPFLVGDGARGTAYSSVFIAVFYLFLFPFQGYRLIRYDHIKEAKRLASLTEVMNAPQGRTLEEQRNQGNFNTSEVTLAGVHQRSETSKSQAKDGFLHSPQMPHRSARPENTTFSATSTMISMDGPTEFYDEDHDNRTRELRYHPNDESFKERHASPPPPSSRLPSHKANYSLAGEPNPFIHIQGQEQSDSNVDMSRTNTLTNNGPHPHQVFSMSPLKAAGSPYSHVTHSPESGRHSIESMASNGTGVSRFSSAHDDDRRLIPDKSPRARTRTNTGKGYRPPSLIQRPQPMYPGPYSGGSGPSSGGSSTHSKPSSPSPFISLTPPDNRDNYNHAKLASSSSNDTLTNVPLEATDEAPLPKVPPALQGTYTANHANKPVWLRWFNAIREYLTPPTLGLLLGLLVALTPLRVLFVMTDHPVASPDELPPLSFILEITLLLGGCCVPLGLTVLGASLSRLKPGRMRPLIPALTMITISKLIISPLIGIAVVQLVLVRHFGWVPAHNNMLQFTLMLMCGSPTSITCFVLAQVWDRRTKNSGSEMAAVIAVQYATSTVLLTVLSACMMYFLF